jgi:hypothetical protein
LVLTPAVLVADPPVAAFAADLPTCRPPIHPMSGPAGGASLPGTEGADRFVSIDRGETVRRSQNKPGETT